MIQTNNEKKDDDYDPYLMENMLAEIEKDLQPELNLREKMLNP